LRSGTGKARRRRGLRQTGAGNAFGSIGFLAGEGAMAEEEGWIFI